jgi:hypothetical protein
VHHWLLLDREERRFYVIPARDGERFFAELPEAVEERRRWEALSPEERERLHGGYPPALSRAGRMA